jgi:hypothetical protein
MYSPSSLSTLMTICSASSGTIVMP